MGRDNEQSWKYTCLFLTIVEKMAESKPNFNDIRSTHLPLRGKGFDVDYRTIFAIDIIKRTPAAARRQARRTKGSGGVRKRYNQT